MKKYIVVFIIGGLICSIVTVFAVQQYSASQIIYKGTTLDLVLDDLYEASVSENNIIVANWLNENYTSNTTWTTAPITIYNSSYFTALDNILTVKIAGTYRLYYQAISDGGATATASIKILKNGSSIASCSANYGRCSNSLLTYDANLSVGDTIAVQLKTSTRDFGARTAVAMMKIN